MKTTDEQLVDKAMDALFGALSPVEVTRFVALMGQDRGDYTKDRHKWLENLNFRLPKGAQLRGGLDSDPNADYPIEDVLEIELTDGRMIDVSWDKISYPSLPFRIVAYKGDFRNCTYDSRLKTEQEVHAKVQELINEQ